MRINQLRHIWSLPGIIYLLIQTMRTQKKFIQKTIAQDILQAKEQNDGTLTESDFRKITNYYALIVPGILGEAFCSLRGYAMTDEERYASTYQCALTGLFDDYFDKGGWTEEILKRIIDDPYSVEAGNSNQRLFLTLCKKMLIHPHTKSRIEYDAKQIFTAQIESKKQLNSAITLEEIESVTLFKGGASLLFNRSIFDHPITQSERQFLYQLGGLLQLANDIFDIYKDREAGISTLATTETHIDNLRKYVHLWRHETIALAYKMPYPVKRIRKFLRLVSAVICRVDVCLAMLEKNENKTGGRFLLQQYTRSELICDMEKPSNLAKLFFFYFNSHV